MNPRRRLIASSFVCSCVSVQQGWKPREGKGAARRMDKERAMGGKVGGSMEVGNQIADERKQAGEINLPISAACC